LLLAAVPGDYAGSAACKSCHPSEYASQSSTAHATALARSKPDQPGEWAFGSGSQAITFVSRAGRDHYLEHGESWYSKLNRYALTPGHTKKAGERYRIFDPSAAILRCFACHSTGKLMLSADDTIVPAESGVRCEACHGPAATHVRDPAHSRPQNPRKLTADQMNELCGGCHRMPSAAGATTDLRNPWNARHQPLMFAASACFRKSDGRLTCLTCHAPHAPLERKLAAYDATCAKCHAMPRHTNPVAGRSCVECHMPAVRPQEGLAFANHRIAVYTAADPLSPIRVPAPRRP
jgi:hypothetical protein